MMDAPTGRVCRRDQMMSCKVCGVVMWYDFDVPDDHWKRIVPAHFQARVICAGCFHRFALAGGVSRWIPDEAEDLRGMLSGPVAQREFWRGRALAAESVAEEACRRLEELEKP